MPPTGTLGELVVDAETRAGALEPRVRELERLVAAVPVQRSLSGALRGRNVSLIAEIKRSSPSRGAISPTLDSVSQARAYEEGGASAISVLTETERFGGSNRDLEAVAGVTSLPILRKDFHVRAIQLFEARSIGASAALLIVRALSPARFREMVATAREVELEVVAEVRNLSELERALEAGCRIIGVNNRNLETLEVEPFTAETIIPRIPPELIAVAESGYASVESVASAAAAGADAVLIGSFLSSADDVEAAVRSLAGVTRVSRGA